MAPRCGAFACDAIHLLGSRDVGKRGLQTIMCLHRGRACPALRGVPPPLPFGIENQELKQFEKEPESIRARAREKRTYVVRHEPC